MKSGIQIPDQQVLYYLGYKDQPFDDNLLENINSCINKALDNIDIRYTYKMLSSLEAKSLNIPGRTINELIEQSSKLFIFAATLGYKADQLIHRSQIVNMSEAVIIDACLNVAIEQLCDSIETKLREHYQKSDLYVYDRFSPGYGDLLLSYQPTLCTPLDKSRKIGLNVSDHLIMNLKKSVSAVCAISDKPFKHRLIGCENCSMFF